MLCVDTTVLKTSADVQKDVDLADILINHTKHYACVDEALNHKYAPLNICMSMRSCYSNLVMQRELPNTGYRYYVNIGELQNSIHKGYDFIMFVTSVAVMQCIKEGQGDMLNEVMMKSEFSPIGLYNPDPACVNPMVYSHVILSDEVVDKLSEIFKDGIKFVPISEVKSNHVGNIKALIDTLIEVKGENEHE